MARRLSDSVTVYTGGNADLARELRGATTDPAIAFDTREIAQVGEAPRDNKNIVQGADGSEPKVEGFLVHTPATDVNGPLAKQLSLAMTPTGDIQVSQPFNETSVPGVFAVGDCATLLKAISPGIAMGSATAMDW